MQQILGLIQKEDFFWFLASDIGEQILQVVKATNLALLILNLSYFMEKFHVKKKIRVRLRHPCARCFSMFIWLFNHPHTRSINCLSLEIICTPLRKFTK